MNNKRLFLTGLIQAAGLTVYCTLVSLIFVYGKNIFGNTPGLWASAVFLIIFAMSALICALITLGYPVYVYLRDNDINTAARIAVYTAGWLFLFTLIMLAARVLL
ncbi:MAG: hypothetical protein JXJ19_08830 [Elusimicrobia bacterium]|nr:hypothetical protein [Elusimicrobiota bacterium]